MNAEWFRPRDWQLGHDRRLTLGPRAVIMGVLNVTPDSFSDGGEFIDPKTAVQRAREMLGQGARIIDVGGESTRPGADSVDGETERARILPVIARLAAETDAILSVDTYRAKTAEAAVKAGAHIINDVWGCQKQPDIAGIAAKTSSGLIVMHTSRERQTLDDVIADQQAFFEQSRRVLSAHAVLDECLVVDPGFGFGKDGSINLKLLNRLDQLHTVTPLHGSKGVLVGTSRKRFLGTITGRDASERGAATAATSVIARMKGAAIFRVHDIAMNRDALAVADALIASAFESDQQ